MRQFEMIKLVMCLVILQCSIFDNDKVDSRCLETIVFEYDCSSYQFQVVQMRLMTKQNIIALTMKGISDIRRRIERETHHANIVEEP